MWIIYIICIRIWNLSIKEDGLLTPYTGPLLILRGTKH
jgi:hypothetical protein